MSPSAIEAELSLYREVKGDEVMGDIIFKFILLALVLGLLVFIWHGDRRNRREREAEERAALEAEARRREDGVA